MSIDAHKWLFVPKACSALLVKKPELLARAFTHNEAYIPHEHGDTNAVDVTLEYSRPLRALKLWLAFKVHGAQGMRDAVEDNLAQAQLLYTLALAAPDLDVLESIPELSTVPLSHVPQNISTADNSRINAHNAALQLALVADGRIYISPAQIDGNTWLRPCFINFRTTNADVQVAFDVIREVSNALAST